MKKQKNKFEDFIQKSLMIIFYIAFALGGIWLIKILIRGILG